MYNLLAKKGMLYAFLLGLVVIVLFFVPVMSGLDSFNALEKGERGTTGIFDMGLWLTIILVIAAALIILFFGVMSFITNIKGSMQSLLTLGALLVIFLIGYFMTAEPAATTKLAATITKFEVPFGTQKLINGALFLGVGMVLITGLTFVLSEVRNAIK